MIRALCLLLVAPLAVGHDWCGKAPPGKGLLHVERDDIDVMCGFIEAKADGPHKFLANVPGTKVWIGKKLVRDSVPMAANEIYAIHIEAPKSKDFELKWDWAGAAMTIPVIALHQPSATVGAPCARI